MSRVLTILAGACCASLALAQPGTTTKTDTTTITQYHRTSTVVGTSFMLGRESVGKVVDVVFNQIGCIEYVLVQDSEGFVVVPWSVVTVNYDQKVTTVQSTTATVDNLREVRFTEARLPNFTDPAFVSRMTTVWGATAIRSGAGTGTTRPGAGSGTAPDRPGSGTTPPDRPGTGTTPPDRKGGTTTPPDRPGSGTTPPGKGGTTTPPKTDPANPPKTDPATPPKKDKDKDGR